MANFDSRYYWYVPLIIWETVWKAYALWKSAQAKHKYWFVALILINSIGILPIVYLVFFNKDNFAAKHKWLPKHLFKRTKRT